MSSQPGATQPAARTADRKRIENSGDWLYDVGLPAKSGIGGGIVTVSPGKGGMGTFSPPLDEAGNSVRGQLAARFLSAELGMDLLISAPRDLRSAATTTAALRIRKLIAL